MMSATQAMPTLRSTGHATTGQPISRRVDANSDVGPRVVVAGAPGVGKTTLLAELARRGCNTVSDSAREIIAERKAKGLPPRPHAAAFALAVLQRDIAKYRAVEHAPGLVFFDRSALEARHMLLHTGASRENHRDLLEAPVSFHRQVFLLPPWRAIYCTDSERDHSFEHALAVHTEVVAFYSGLGYVLHLVSPASPEERANHVLRLLGYGDA